MLCNLAKHAHELKIPFKSFWQALSNIALMKHYDIEINHLVQILYYLNKEGFADLELHKEFLNNEQRDRFKRISKYASF